MSDDRRFEKPDGECPFRHAEQLRLSAYGIRETAGSILNKATRVDRLDFADKLLEEADRCVHGLTCENGGRADGE